MVGLGDGAGWLPMPGRPATFHIVGQGPAVLAAGAERVGYIFFIFHLSSISNVQSFWNIETL